MQPTDNTKDTTTDAPQTPQTNNKMSHAEPLREHAFSVPSSTHGGQSEQSGDGDTNAPRMETENIAAGGAPGTVDGDTQKLGEVPTIMDQNEATPDFAQQR